MSGSIKGEGVEGSARGGEDRRPGKVAGATQLLEEGAAVDFTDRYGSTALIRSCTKEEGLCLGVRAEEFHGQALRILEESLVPLLSIHTDARQDLARPRIPVESIRLALRKYKVVL